MLIFPRSAKYAHPINEKKIMQKLNTNDISPRFATILKTNFYTTSYMRMKIKPLGQPYPSFDKQYPQTRLVHVPCIPFGGAVLHRNIAFPLV